MRVNTLLIRNDLRPPASRPRGTRHAIEQSRYAQVHNTSPGVSARPASGNMRSIQPMAIVRPLRTTEY